MDEPQTGTRRLLAAINTTLDGFCDHTAMIADDELHVHYSTLLGTADTVLYGRKTYQLMEYWQTLVKTPSGNKAEDDFAVTIDKISKIVFSHTLKQVDWKTARLAKKGLEDEVRDLNGQPGRTILVGSPSLIVALAKRGLIDEYQLCVHPVILGTGLPLFQEITGRIDLRFLGSQSFVSGATILHYEVQKS